MGVSPVYKAMKGLPGLTEWSKGGKVHSPVDGSQIKGFKRWVNVNGFMPEDHSGFDYMAYETQDGRVTVGLPSGTPVYSLLDGIVLQIANPGKYSYHSEIWTAHSFSDSAMLSSGLAHVNPVQGLKERDPVSKGQLIGHLMQKHGAFYDYQYHLHVGLVVGWGSFDELGLFAGRIIERYEDPCPVLFPEVEPPFASYRHPEIKFSDHPERPVFPDEIETYEMLRRNWFW